MEYRALGQTGLNASAIGFGCGRIARSSAPDQRREAVATLERALACGINLFDTANAFDESERLLGRVFRGQRSRLILCSKAGYRSWALVALEQRWRLPLGWLRRMLPAQPRAAGGAFERDRRRNFAPRSLTLALEGSLRRLGTDYLDIFYLHSPPPEVVADDRVFETLERLKQRGSIRHYGISFANGATTDQVLAALGRDTGISIVQVRANALQSVDLNRLAPAARQRGVAIVGREPFHSGSVFSAPLAAALTPPPGRTAAQTLLGAMLRRPGVDVVLVGMSTRAHLDENLGALATPSPSAREAQILDSFTRTI